MARVCKSPGNSLNSARHLLSPGDSNGKLGAVGFCRGGGTVNQLAVQMGGDLAAGVPFYGAAPASANVSDIQAPSMIRSAEDDERINAMWPDFESALQAADLDYEHHVYPGTMHGFHNNSTPRYDEEQAAIAEQCTVDFFTRHLA